MALGYCLKTLIKNNPPISKSRCPKENKSIGGPVGPKDNRKYGKRVSKIYSLKTQAQVQRNNQYQFLRMAGFIKRINKTNATTNKQNESTNSIRSPQRLKLRRCNIAASQAKSLLLVYTICLLRKNFVISSEIAGMIFCPASFRVFATSD